MNKQSDIGVADFIALTAILGLTISGSLNWNQSQEINRLLALSEYQELKIQTMERTLLMTK